MKILPGVGVKCPVDDGREFIICEWFILLPKDDTDEWLTPIIDDVPPPRDVTIDCCCWCWLSNWSRGGDIGSAFILTGAGDDEEGGGGVLFDTAKWGIPLKVMKKGQSMISFDDTNYLVCCNVPKFWCEEFHDVIIFKSDDDIEKSCAPNVLTG